MRPTYCLCLMAFCIIVLVNTATGGPRGVVEIGKGVKVDVHVLYAPEIRPYIQKINNKSPAVESNNDDSLDYFNDLFRLVQMYFHYYKIMVNFTVTSVKQETDLIVNFGTENKTIDGPATLEKVKKYAANAAVKAPNDAIYYLFTWNDIIDYYNETWNMSALSDISFHNFSSSSVATYKTFCSNHTSAAVVKLTVGNLKVYNTAKATAFTHCFGRGSEHGKKKQPSILMC
ncbi:uncharacterized protein LOC142563683 isoform X2 [Dermacentor variabilis]|uniref:uncharacterized protein LOC142563683 isoform X2 n=1 Tax=Dermacentor variabilis TaxID=34621 RepID=UPI003F5C29F5